MDASKQEAASARGAESNSGILDTDSRLITAIGHLYRGEMSRVTIWRQRLDETSKWAVTVLAAVLVYAFSSSDTSHAVLLAGIVVLTVFLGIEARRYQTYEIWRSRIRLMQENLFARILNPSESTERTNWREELSRDYRNPTAKIMYREALQRRLRRVYLPLLVMMLAAWIFRIGVISSDTLPGTASVGQLPGPVVIGSVIIFYVLVFTVTFWPYQRQAKEEIQRTNIGQWKDTS